MSRRKDWLKFGSKKQGEVFWRYETIYDVIDALAAIAFIAGSALFFKASTEGAATWLFLVGSIFFAVRPLIHVLRDFHMARLPASHQTGAGEEE